MLATRAENDLLIKVEVVISKHNKLSYV